MINWLAGAVGGVLVVLIPLLCLRFLNDESLTRSLIVIVIISAGAVFVLGILLASQKIIAAIIFGSIAGGLWYWRGRTSGADYTVSGPLLGDSTAPELEAQLAAVEAEESGKLNHEKRADGPQPPSF